MATRFDSFTSAECNILVASLAVFRDSYYAAAYPKLVNGAAPSRDNLLSELQNATNWSGKHQDLGSNLHTLRQ